MPLRCRATHATMLRARYAFMPLLFHYYCRHGFLSCQRERLPLCLRFDVYADVYADATPPRR